MNKFLPILLLIIIIIVVAALFILLSKSYDDYCKNVECPEGQQCFEGDCYPNIPQLKQPKICPTVCIPMWSLNNGQCIYNDCGSGCGPNGETTFDTEEECEANL